MPSAATLTSTHATTGNKPTLTRLRRPLPARERWPKAGEGHTACFYDPALGRFASADTIIPGAGNPQSWDRYAYVNNSPLMYTDPSGHRACDGIDCEGSQNPVGEYAAVTSNIRKTIARNKVLASQPMVAQLPYGQPQGITYNTPTIGPLTTPFYRSSAIIDFVDDLAGHGQFYRNGKVLVDAVEAAANVGTPVWRQVKGPLPADPVTEGAIGALIQLSRDMADRDTIRPAKEIGLRAAYVGVEDGITAAISTPIAAALGVIGTGCGPGAPVCAGALYLAGSIGTTWAMDTFVWKPINQQFFGIY